MFVGNYLVFVSVGGQIDKTHAGQKNGVRATFRMCDKTG